MSLPLLLLAVLLAVVAWMAVDYVLPAWRLQAALRRVAQGDWEAPAFIRHRGQLGSAVADLAVLGERLRDTHRQLGDSSFDLQAILGSLAEGVLIVDAAQRIRLANASLLRMFDLASPPLERSLMEVFRNHDLQGTVRAALEEPQPQNRQLSLEARQGASYVRKHFTVTAAALRTPDDERPHGVIAVFHDISELKALEAVRRDFVANVSHELRTPIAIIHGYLETLLDGALDDRAMAEKSLGVMWKNNQRLMLLIEDLLSLSRLEGKGVAALQFEPVELRTCLERVVERLEPAITEKGATVRLDLPPDLPIMEADPHRLDQVFFNLIENALKYGEAERREIVVGAERLGEDFLEITVRDNGPGIPSADLPHVFERFYRVKKDRSRAVGGTGLGLSIVKHVVQAHGGQASVQSQPGRGATFRLRLPLEQQS